MSVRLAASIEPSMEARTPPLVRLSLRRSRSVFSPLTAPVRDSPVAEPGGDPGGDPIPPGGLSPELPELTALSSNDGLLGEGVVSELPRSVQSAGVGGTGPRAVTPLGGGRRVGGD